MRVIQGFHKPNRDVFERGAYTTAPLCRRRRGPQVPLAKTVGARKNSERIDLELVGKILPALGHSRLLRDIHPESAFTPTAAI
jgi:hypothetical protein